jgi:hypothetical protein
VRVPSKTYMARMGLDMGGDNGVRSMLTQICEELGLSKSQSGAKLHTSVLPGFSKVPGTKHGMHWEM